MIVIYNNNRTFTEIINSISEILNKNGIKTEITNVINEKDKNLYILFGMNNYFGELPPNYIVFQFEQTAVNIERPWFNERYINIMRGALEIWDYSLRNIQNLKKYGLKNFKYVPLCYSKSIDRIINVEPEIDVLFYGSINERREDLYNRFIKEGVSAQFYWNSLWGEELDKKIAKAKIVLNIHFYEEPILETSRLQYLLCNRKFIISERSCDPILDFEYSNYIVFSDIQDIVSMCKLYLLDDEKRNNFAQAAYEKYKATKFNIPLKLLLEYKDKFIIPATRIDDDGSLVLLLDGVTSFPTVSLITPTYNRKHIFSLPMRNFRLFDYPQDRLQWVIVDDSIYKMTFSDPQIKYIHLDKRHSISEKRNIAVANSNGEIIIHMDDDDYYPPYSILSRVKLLAKYKAGCVGCSKIGIYDIIEDNSFVMETPHISEASMGYTRKFWEERNFPNYDVTTGEGIPFTEGRESQIVDMPYMYNLIAITHKDNITKNFRKSEKADSYNFFNALDFNTQLFFSSLRKSLL
jgi:hypothetical protein